MEDQLPDGVSDQGIPLSETSLTTIVEHLAASTEDSCSIVTTPTGDGVAWMCQIVVTGTPAVLARATAIDFIDAVQLACGRGVEAYAKIESDTQALSRYLSDEDED